MKLGDCQLMWNIKRRAEERKLESEEKIRKAELTNPGRASGGNLLLLVGSPFGTRKIQGKQNDILYLSSILPRPAVLGVSSGTLCIARLHLLQRSLSLFLTCHSAGSQEGRG